MGIIELGSTGFNAFIVQMDQLDHWRLEKAIYSQSFVTEGKITINHVFNTIQSYKDSMISFGVSTNEINLVASSSATKDPEVGEILDQLRSMNIGVINVSTEQEGKYALKATIPRELMSNSYLVDIGSGNTKVCWVENNETKTLETYGSKYYTQGIRHIDAHKAVKETIASIPEANQALCFVIGGAAYKLASITDSLRAPDQRYTILEDPDQYIFEEEANLAAVNLYRAIWSEKTISYVFDWDTNFSIGVLAEVN